MFLFIWDPVKLIAGTLRHPLRHFVVLGPLASGNIHAGTHICHRAIPHPAADQAGPPGRWQKPHASNICFLVAPSGGTELRTHKTWLYHWGMVYFILQNTSFLKLTGKHSVAIFFSVALLLISLARLFDSSSWRLPRATGCQSA